MKFFYKIRILLLSLILLFTGSVFVSTAARADSLDVLGGVVTWPDKMYLPDGCSSFAFQYRNNTGVELLQLGFIISDPFGRSVERESQIGIGPNKSGTWNVQMCSFDFKNGLGPYIIKVFVSDYSSTQREVQKEIYFLPIPNSAGSGSSGSGLNPVPTVTVTAKPAPAPTVTVTATPAPAPTVYTVNPADQSLADMVKTLTNVVRSQTGQLSTLNAKLKKICSAKPKPKGC
jgi:hypothetical protein